MRVRLEVQLATAAIGYVRVQLGRRQVGVSEHLLDAPQVCAPFEEMGRERVAEQVRVDARRVETCLRCTPAQDQESAGTRQWAALCVEEELRTVPTIEVRASASEVAAQRLRGLASDRDDPFLVALADAAHDAIVQRDAALFQSDGLRDAEAGAVEKLDESAVAEVARLRPRGGLDQALGLAG